MNRQPHKLLYLLIPLIWSCQPKEKEEPFKNVSDEFSSYSLNLNPQKLKWIDLIDEIKVIGLEETEESLLGRIDNLTITDSMIVYGHGGENTMYFFDRSGRFIDKFNKRGDGPEEYTRLWDYWLDGDVVRINDFGNKRIADYSFAGDFIKETPLPYLSTHVTGNGKQLWFDMTTGYAKDSIYARLVKYNPETKEESYYLQKDRMPKFMLQTTLNSFKPYKQGVVFKEFLSDSVYLIQGENYRPFMHFNFGEEYFWKGKALSYDFQEGMAEIQRSGKVWQISSIIGNRMVYLRCNTTQSIRTYRSYLLDRESGNQVELDFSKSPEENFSFEAHIWYQDQLVISMSSSDVGELLGQLEKGQYSFEGGGSLASIESSENPALMFITFKNSLK